MRVPVVLMSVNNVDIAAIPSLEDWEDVLTKRDKQLLKFMKLFLRRFSYKEGVNEAPSAMIELSNFNNVFTRYDLDKQIFKGAKIILRFGYADKLCEPRVLYISQVRYSFGEDPFIILECDVKPLVQEMMNIKRTRTWENCSIVSIIKYIKDKYNIQIKADPTKVAKKLGISLKDLIWDKDMVIYTTKLYFSLIKEGLIAKRTYLQKEETDLQFLARLLSKYGLDIYLTQYSDELYLTIASNYVEKFPVRKYYYYVGESKWFSGTYYPVIQSFTVGVDDSFYTPPKIEKTGFDKDKNVVNVEVDVKDLPMNNPVPVAALEVDPDKDKGYKDLNKLLERDKIQIQTEDVYENQASIKAEAVGYLHEVQKKAMEVECTLGIGDPTLFPPALVQIEGVGDTFSAIYSIKEVTHDIGESGFRTRLKLTSDSVNIKSVKIEVPEIETPEPYKEGVGEQPTYIDAETGESE